MTSADVREKLVEALALDLVGPAPGAALESETLEQAPSNWYLTGFLVPSGAGEKQKTDANQDEEIAAAPATGGGDDDTPPDPPAARRAHFPSSMGLSVLIPQPAKRIDVEIRWGDYRPNFREQEDEPAEDRGHPISWTRTARVERIAVELPANSGHLHDIPVPNSRGLHLAVNLRAINTAAFNGMIPEGARSASFFLVNRRAPDADNEKDAAFVFQASLHLECAEGFVPRADYRGLPSNEWDERVADLQYHDCFEFGVGHGVSARATCRGDQCNVVETTWIPRAEVARVAPEPISGVELDMEKLAAHSTVELEGELRPLVEQYRVWIGEQKAKAPKSPRRRADTGAELVKLANVAANRIELGIKLLADKDVLTAFQIANRAMAVAARRRIAAAARIAPEAVETPQWRPFQLAFILMNLKGIADPTDDDRNVVDLLFFPTAGGKTEAYLGLAAFTLVLRRLRNPGIASAGVSVLMRYTLRLLTLDQLGRAATLICALEMERRNNADILGGWPFEIGLWVGRGATPNEMGAKGDKNNNSARSRTIAFQNDSKHKPSPIPLENCPWCGTKFIAESFSLVPHRDHPSDLRITCCARDCDFTRNRPLPIVAVDEPIYRRLPCFIIATVDKFAAMPWTGRVGGFFGRVDRHDEHGFYGPCDPAVGMPLPTELQPPDLVIQDELHLISGPMGTMVGLYETALDELCARTVGSKEIRPKIVASTATVRRAEQQIRALFNRNLVDIFPPPGPDRRTSFFARVHTSQESDPRLYLGVAAQGRSLKVIMLRSYLALMAAAQKCYLACGGHKNHENPADPYMTLVGYFNSLRELGGSRRIIEDEVRTRLRGYGRRVRVGEDEGGFAERNYTKEVVELTSRVGTDEVADAKRMLALPYREKESVEVAIATNMISVGLDITRLGLMVILGQPKTHAEYIQASSRVGRDPTKPGLVLTVLNVHRPRDRSHYERFASYHETFYRSVEATSVTPFSPRALDRGLAGTLVALARQGCRAMTPARGAAQILRQRSALDGVVDALAERAGEVLRDSPDAEAIEQRVRIRAKDLLDEWHRIATEYQEVNGVLQYQYEEGGAARLLYEFLNPEANTPRRKKFRANRSMRDVEPNVGVWVRTSSGQEVEAEDEE